LPRKAGAGARCRVKGRHQNPSAISLEPYLCAMPRLILIRHAEAVAHAPQGDLKRPVDSAGIPPTRCAWALTLTLRVSFQSSPLFHRPGVRATRSTACCRKFPQKPPVRNRRFALRRRWLMSCGALLNEHPLFHKHLADRRAQSGSRGICSLSRWTAKTPMPRSATSRPLA